MKLLIRISSMRRAASEHVQVVFGRFWPRGGRDSLARKADAG